MILKSGRLCALAPQNPGRHSLTKQSLKQLDSEEGSSQSSSTDANSSTITWEMDVEKLYHLQIIGIMIRNDDELLPPDDKNTMCIKLHRKRNDPGMQENMKSFMHNFKGYPNKSEGKRNYLSLFTPGSRSHPNSYRSVTKILWNRVPENAFDLDTKLSAPKPDYFEAFDMMNPMYPLEANSALTWLLKPSSQYWAMPILCAEFKGSGKAVTSAHSQLAYNGGIMLHSRWEVHKLIGDPAEGFFGKTKALLFGIADKHVEIFACHAQPWDDIWTDTTPRVGYPKKIKCHIYSLAELAVRSDKEVETLYRWIRNAQEWCFGQADSVRTGLWDHFGSKMEIDQSADEGRTYGARKDAIEGEKAQLKRKAVFGELEQSLPGKRLRKGL